MRCDPNSSRYNYLSATSGQVERYGERAKTLQRGHGFEDDGHLIARNRWSISQSPKTRPVLCACCGLVTNFVLKEQIMTIMFERSTSCTAMKERIDFTMIFVPRSMRPIWKRLSGQVIWGCSYPKPPRHPLARVQVRWPRTARMYSICYSSWGARCSPMTCFCARCIWEFSF